MVKQNKAKTKKVKRPTRRPKQKGSRGLSRTSNPTFGAVSTINTAPVAIGNSMRGAKAQVITNSGDSLRVVGRDYAFTSMQTAAVPDWLPVGGFPLTPACFVSSALRSYTQIYNKFKFNAMACHYITSSSTSTTGDVMFQYNKNRTDPCAAYSSSTFLNYTLSDPLTVIGPQWTNHTVMLKPKGPFRTLDVGLNNDIDYQSQGEIFLYSKTSSTDSPGYVIIDYDITFSEMSINPRSGVLPNPQLIYQPVQLVWPTTALTVNTSNVIVSVTGRGGYGATTAVPNVISPLSAQPNFRSGDIYKFIFQATYVNVGGAYTLQGGTIPTNNSLLATSVQGTTVGLNLTDGYTLYLLCSAAGTCEFYANPTMAFTSSVPIKSGQTFQPVAFADGANGVPTAGVWAYGIASWIGNVSPSVSQQS